MMKKVLLALVKFNRWPSPRTGRLAAGIFPPVPNMRWRRLRSTAPSRAAGWRSGVSCAVIRFTREDMIRSHERRGQAPLPDPVLLSGRLSAGTAECGQAESGNAPLCGR